MRIDHLKIQNFRCFEQAEFRFSPRFNLLVGVNGVGKTSLLKAVVVAMVPPLNGLGQYAEWLHGDESHARMALRDVNGKARFERCSPVKLEVEAMAAGTPRAWSAAYGGPPFSAFSNEVSFLADQAEEIGFASEGALPVVAFYPAERHWRLSGVNAEASIQQRESRLDAYRSWHEASLDIKGLESWIIAKSLERLEEGAPLRGGPPDELELVNRAVAQAIPGSKGLHYSIKYRQLLLEWQDASPTPFDNLSDGQRTLAALVTDIARRMCLLNPQLDDRVLEETPGIIVIDELDMHLHPTWQRAISHVLMAAFPRVQFFAASHSPQIIGELKPEHILLMRDGKAAGHPERSFGLDSGEVLKELMGGQARNPDVDDELRVIHRAIDDDDTERAQDLLNQLKLKAALIPAVQEAQSAINSLTLLGDSDS